MRLSSIPISADTWMYAEPDGLSVIHWRTDSMGRRLSVSSIVLPWAQVRLALAIKDNRKLPRGTVAKDSAARRPSKARSLPRGKQT